MRRRADLRHEGTAGARWPWNIRQARNAAPTRDPILIRTMESARASCTYRRPVLRVPPKDSRVAVPMTTRATGPTSPIHLSGSVHSRELTAVAAPISQIRKPNTQIGNGYNSPQIAISTTQVDSSRCWRQASNIAAPALRTTSPAWTRGVTRGRLIVTSAVDIEGTRRAILAGVGVASEADVAAPGDMTCVGLTSGPLLPAGRGPAGLACRVDPVRDPDDPDDPDDPVNPGPGPAKLGPGPPEPGSANPGPGPAKLGPGAPDEPAVRAPEGPGPPAADPAGTGLSGTAERRSSAPGPV